jgi:hypothetical protein
MKIMGIGELVSGIGGTVQFALGKCAALIRSHLVIAGSICGAALIIVVLLIILAVERHSPPKAKTPARPDAAEAFKERSVSPDEFFMPGEPDFVPEVILGREPRSGWTEEDARPFWTDPLDEAGEDVWKRRLDADMDALLENVP